MNRPVALSPVPLTQYLAQELLVDRDPADADYQERYTAEMVQGFRLLSLLVLGSMAVLFVVHLIQSPGSGAASDAPTAMACALLSCAGGVGLFASKSIQSPRAAFAGAAALLAAAVVVMAVDRLHGSGQRIPIGPLIPITFAILVLAAALLPLRPHRVLMLGALFVASAGVASFLMGVQYLLDVVDAVSAVVVIGVSVLVAARSTSQRIRIHQAHASALASERQAEAARQRALIAESVITMERLAASLSHEMNTPIGALRSAAETLVRGVRKEAQFPAGSRLPNMLHELTDAITASTARLGETVGRIQRFANLDRSVLRLVDINQIVQDAVALMNPPSMTQAHVELNLEPVPSTWCRPHGLSVAISSILNTVLDSALPVTIHTSCEGNTVVVKVTCSLAESEFQARATPGFGIVGGHVRASGWDLFAARHLVLENGGELRLTTGPQQVVTLILPVDPTPPQDGAARAAAQPPLV
ncbi:MAG: histidine kinase dimerization/phospho-acceptor domain-containing protein [Bryobacteraceae bacterium]|nr:histidine kinase dimerization/phospho-acceptor domain-containing protein [Bryobacteraceae bacterium]